MKYTHQSLYFSFLLSTLYFKITSYEFTSKKIQILNNTLGNLIHNNLCKTPEQKNQPQKKKKISMKSKQFSYTLESTWHTSHFFIDFLSQGSFIKSFLIIKNYSYFFLNSKEHQISFNFFKNFLIFSLILHISFLNFNF